MTDDLYQTLIEAQNEAGEGFLIAEGERILYANEACSRIGGYSVAELLALPSLFALVVPEQRDLLRERFRERLGGRRVIDRYESAIVHKSGRRVDVEVIVKLFREDRARRVILIRDITERKRAEEALKESEERFRSLVQYTSDIISVVEVDGTVRYESPAFERVMGYRPEELVGQNAFNYVHPDDVERVLDTFVEVLDTRGVNPPVRFRLRHADGSWRYLEVVGNNLLDEPSVRGIIANARDVTERKRAEEALEESEERYRRLVELSPDAIAVHSEGRLVYINPAGEKLIGATSSEEVIGKPVLDFVHPDYREIARERIRLALEEGKQTEPIEEKLVRLDGQTVDVEVAGSPVTYRGKPAVQKVIRDVTERKPKRHSRGARSGSAPWSRTPPTSS